MGAPVRAMNPNPLAGRLGQAAALVAAGVVVVPAALSSFVPGSVPHRLRRGTLVDAMLERQERNVRFWQRMRERTDTVETAARQIDDWIAWSHRERAVRLSWTVPQADVLPAGPEYPVRYS
ncbi:hypothetical protein [Streptomyces sp. NPDC096311]|uniref:hypothetical protein n=1 Tax=Streptomyces sp. NPDC096311 TaxID=3366083 RepID=UPI0037FF043F